MVLTLARAADGYAPVFHIHIDQCGPHAVKDLMDVRLELKGSDIEEPYCATRLVDGHSIQLSPRLFQQVEGIENAALVAGLLDHVQCVAHGLDAPERILYLAVVVELAGEELGPGFCLADGLARGLWGVGLSEYLVGERLGSEDVVLHRLGVRFPCADIVGRLLVDDMYLGLGPANCQQGVGSRAVSEKKGAPT